MDDGGVLPSAVEEVTDRRAATPVRSHGLAASLRYRSCVSMDKHREIKNVFDLTSANLV